MATLSESMIEQLLSEYITGAPAPKALYLKLGVYLELLLKWNAKTNLTAIRSPEDIVRRHFGESLFLAQHLPAAKTLVDVGSGAGFPGIPIQLLLPEVAVTLAESQGKKATFLREAVRVLELGTIVHAARIEEMEVGRRFDIAAMRAVDKMEIVVPAAKARIVPGGWLALLSTGSNGIPVPRSTSRVVELIQC